MVSTNLLLFGTVAVIAYLAFFPVPVGYDRGKIKWNTWCWTGAHTHTVYWWGRDRGFQTLHPADKS